MPHKTKFFTEKLNRALDELDVPTHSRERSLILSKMLDIPKQQAWGLLEGQIYPDDDLLKKIANELEVTMEWFLEDDE